MASRDITGAVLRTCFGAVRKGVTPSRLLTDICDEVASAQRDLDITGDVDSAYYYEGMIDAFRMVAHWIAPIKNDELYSQLLGLQTEADISKEKAA